MAIKQQKLFSFSVISRRCLFINNDEKFILPVTKKEGRRAKTKTTYTHTHKIYVHYPTKKHCTLTRYFDQHRHPLGSILIWRQESPLVSFLKQRNTAENQPSISGLRKAHKWHTLSDAINKKSQKGKKVKATSTLQVIHFKFELRRISSYFFHYFIVSSFPEKYTYINLCFEK